MSSMINVECIIIVMALILLCINGYPYHRPYHHQNRERGWTYSSNGNGRCFSGDSLVKLSNGQDKQIDSLNIGDEILTIDQSKLIATEIIMMLDKQYSKKEHHLIPIISYHEKLNYKIAKGIQMGDLLFGLFNNQVIPCRVINITNQIKTGYYAPLTMKGTLLVNEILASSFAHVNNHHLAQFYMFPIRYYYKLTRLINSKDPFYIYTSDGLNWFIKIMFYFARCFRSDILILT